MSAWIITVWIYHTLCCVQKFKHKVVNVSVTVTTSMMILILLTAGECGSPDFLERSKTNRKPTSAAIQATSVNSTQQGTPQRLLCMLWHNLVLWKQDLDQQKKTKNQPLRLQPTLKSHKRPRNITQYICCKCDSFRVWMKKHLLKHRSAL